MPMDVRGLNKFGLQATIYRTPVHDVHESLIYLYQLLKKNVATTANLNGFKMKDAKNAFHSYVVMYKLIS